MSTLLLRLTAPMQSWGVSSKFDRRLTETAPTKSGIIGLLACAMGIRRDDSLTVFNDIRFGVRIDQPGELGIDFQMVHEQKASKNTASWVTYRHYLYDAVFLAGIEGDEELLKRFDQALHYPVFPIYLGRRSCPPSGPVSLGIRNTDLREALQQEPWLAQNRYKMWADKNGVVFLEIIRDAYSTDSGTYTIRDVPITFSQTRRKYRFRNIIREKISLGKVWQRQNNSIKKEYISTSHNPMEFLEEYDVSIKS